MRLRPDVLKLDRSLVAGMSSDPVKGAMIDALARYARRIGAGVCAEGIETHQDLQALADLDVTHGQGFVLGRPAGGWTGVDPSAAAVCTSALSAVIRDDESAERSVVTSELQLDRVCHQIVTAVNRADVRAVLEPIRQLLDVDEVSLSLLSEDGEWLDTVLVHGGEEEGPFALDDYPATVSVLASGEAIQVLTSDPAAEPAEVALLQQMGYRAMLMVPLLAGRRTIGVIEAYAVQERPWSRSQIHSARIIGYQLALVLDHARALVVP
jgi:hypothetical protein